MNRNQIEYRIVPLSELNPTTWNPRQISEADRDALKNSLDHFGCVEPLVIRKEDMSIIGGHQRFNACCDLLMGEAPCAIIDVSETDAKLLNVALNKIHGDWDIDKLGVLIEQLKLGEADISLTGFDDIGLDKIGAVVLKEGKTDPDAVPEPPKAAIIKTGDLWLLGDHRLLCGDSTKAEDVERLMGGEKAGMVFTDPPYAVSYTGGSSNPKPRKDAYWDKYTTEQYAELIKKSLLASNLQVRDKAAYYIWFGDANTWSLLQGCHAADVQERYCIIWRKLDPHYGALGRQYKMQHEPCLYAHKQGHSPEWYGESTEGTIWEVKQPSVNELHPTQKPIELPTRAVRNSSVQGDLVLDLFMGSGSTLIACEKLNRRCYGMEIDPIYCDVIVKRWEEFTGKKAQLSKQEVIVNNG